MRRKRLTILIIHSLVMIAVLTIFLNYSDTVGDKTRSQSQMILYAQTSDINNTIKFNATDGYGNTSDLSWLMNQDYQNRNIAIIILVLLSNGALYLFLSQKKNPEVKGETSDDDALSYQRLHAFLSHEQKNSLALLSSHLQQNNDEVGLKYIRRMRNTIDDVLTLSDEREDLSLSEVDVVMVIAEVCDDYQERSTIDFSFDGMPIIMGKEKWIYRAVANVVDNAIKYSNNKQVNVSTYQMNGSAIIKVQDHGIGIRDDELDLIFDHKVRLNHLKKDGYGVGLSLVNHVCDLCNGVVWVDSIEGEGTTVYLSFPSVNTLLT